MDGWTIEQTGRYRQAIRDKTLTLVWLSHKRKIQAIKQKLFTLLGSSKRETIVLLKDNFLPSSHYREAIDRMTVLFADGPNCVQISTDTVKLHLDIRCIQCCHTLIGVTARYVFKLADNRPASSSRANDVMQSNRQHTHTIHSYYVASNWHVCLVIFIYIVGRYWYSTRVGQCRHQVHWNQ